MSVGPVLIFCLFLLVYFGSIYSKKISRYCKYDGSVFWVIMALLNFAATVFYFLEGVWPICFFGIILGLSCLYLAKMGGFAELRKSK